jgi:3-phenylpropionate/trans-cinnamate dioxygenase ferredoxin reductase component
VGVHQNADFCAPSKTDEVELHPPRWFDEHSIELVHSATVDAIDLAERSVVVDCARHRYRSLVLACGAGLSPPPVPGGERALRLRSHADASRLRRAATRASSAVIIGAGFIGCEAAASPSDDPIAVSRQRCPIDALFARN